MKVVRPARISIRMVVFDSVTWNVLSRKPLIDFGV
jgi:hypothetical protein